MTDSLLSFYTAARLSSAMESGEAFLAGIRRHIVPSTLARRCLDRALLRILETPVLGCAHISSAHPIQPPLTNDRVGPTSPLGICLSIAISAILPIVQPMKTSVIAAYLLVQIVWRIITGILINMMNLAGFVSENPDLPRQEAMFRGSTAASVRDENIPVAVNLPTAFPCGIVRPSPIDGPNPMSLFKSPSFCDGLTTTAMASHISKYNRELTTAMRLF